MAIETEIKYRLNEEQFNQVQQDLKEFDAKYIGEDFEENIIYSNDFLYANKSVLRIRKIDSKTILTFKKKHESEYGVKEHIEHETVVESAEEMQKIIEYLGIEKRLVYEKRRKTWKFREVEVVLDELPFGLFMEIEGTLMAIKEAEMFLGADEYEVAKETYPYLTLNLGKKVGTTIESRF